MSDVVCLELAAALWFVHLWSQMGSAQTAFDTAYLFSSRDTTIAPKGVIWGRASRAFTNFVENLVAFAALDLGLIFVQHSAGWAPTIWLIARAIYLPMYLFDVIYYRTIAAGIAMLCLLFVLWRLAA